jgi:Family of unknown function (DUF6516)
MEIFKWLDNESLVNSFQILDFRKTETIFYLNLKINFIDKSSLQVREFVDESHRKYSFHWQSEFQTLIMRWDNSPHFPDLITFPHHKHLPNNKVESSYDISLEEVFNFILSKIAQV